MKRKNKGITLIALAITIIVLLILAGVSIATLTGQGNILENANNAKQKTNEESIRESIRLAVLSAKTSKREGSLTKEDLENELKSYFKENEFTVEETRDEEGTQTGFKVTVGEVVENIEEKGEKYVGEPTLTVTLKVDEAGVTGTQIPVMVEEVTKDDTQIEENLTYTWLKGDAEEGTDENNRHTFNGLSESKSYTIKCKVSNKSGDWGVAEIKVLSFSVGGSYFRCTDGMTWETWCSSAYDRAAPDSFEEEYMHLQCSYDAYGYSVGWFLTNLFDFFGYNQPWNYGHYVWSYDTDYCDSQGHTFHDFGNTDPIIRSEYSYECPVVYFYAGE